MGVLQSEKFPVRSCTEGIESSARLAPPRERKYSVSLKKYVLCFGPHTKGRNFSLTGRPPEKPYSFSLSLGRWSPVPRLLVNCSAFRSRLRRYSNTLA